MPFRSAHHFIGELVAQAAIAQQPLLEILRERHPRSGHREIAAGSTSAVDMVARLKFGGGAGIWLEGQPLVELADRVARVRSHRTQKVERWAKARAALIEQTERPPAEARA